MIIGVAWKKKNKETGQEFLSCKISLPFFGSVNFAMFETREKSKENSPDYNLVWSEVKNE